jgi:sugar/nucleoside kinase (ribokinase family)
VLATSAESVIVMRGDRGAFALIEGRRVEAPAIQERNPVDPTGAGDVLVAAYVWADQAGVSPEERLRWAVIYAGLSITSPTAVGGAVDEERLLSEGARYGLQSPRPARA